MLILRLAGSRWPDCACWRCSESLRLQSAKPACGLTGRLCGLEVEIALWVRHDFKLEVTSDIEDIFQPTV